MFVVVTVLSGFLLAIYPFYPFYLAVILALLLGALALKFVSASLLIALLLFVLGGTYQDLYVGLTFLVVVALIRSLTLEWAELAVIPASWVLAFFISPSLAIIPTVLAGLHFSRETALKVGALSSLSTFLLAWTRGISQAGLMLISSPTSSHAVKPIQDPWRFDAFVPSLSALNSPVAYGYVTSLVANFADSRTYVLIASWAISGYLIAFLAARWKKPLYLRASVLGASPVLIVSYVFAGASPLDLGLALAGVAVAAVAYKFVQPAISGPGLDVFTGLDDLVGMPQKYSILLGSPVCEERNLVITRFLRPGLEPKAPSFLLTTDMDFARTSKARFGERLTVLIANPRAATISIENAIPISAGIQNLTSLNIELVKALKNASKYQATPGGRACLDVLSDVMLTHKLLTTRKWVADLLPRLNDWGFTVLGTFNPALHSNEDTQGLVDLFKGYLQIFEKHLPGKVRRVIVVRKMMDVQFTEAELILDKDVLRHGKSRKHL
jgi:KaiC/GvpD/RAD55 family RecA-like ATPase